MMKWEAIIEPEIHAQLDTKSKIFLSTIKFVILLNSRMSIFVSFSQKMPVALQPIGNYWLGFKLLNITRQFQQVTDYQHP